jgi:hypothetical protein
VGEQRKTGLGRSRKWPILTQPERIQRGWRRRGVVVVALCAAVVALTAIGEPRMVTTEFALGLAVVAAVGYLLWMVGWTLAGFLRGRDE